MTHPRNYVIFLETHPPLKIFFLTSILSGLRNLFLNLPFSHLNLSASKFLILNTDFLHDICFSYMKYDFLYEIWISSLFLIFFLGVSDHTTVLWKYILNFWHDCFLQQKGFKFSTNSFILGLLTWNLFQVLKKRQTERNRNFFLPHHCTVACR